MQRLTQYSLLLARVLVGYRCLIIGMVMVLCSSCATRESISHSAYPRTKEVWDAYVQISPVSYYKIGFLTFPKSGQGSPDRASDKVFHDVRTRLVQIKALDTSEASPELRNHILQTLSFWGEIASVQPELKREADRLYAGAEESGQRGADMGSNLSEGAPVTDRLAARGSGGLLGMFGGLLQVDSLFTAHVARYGPDALPIVQEEARLARKYGTPNDTAFTNLQNLKEAIYGTAR